MNFKKNKKKSIMTMINTEQAALILNYSKGYMRQLCGKKKIRNELGARKVGRDWILDQVKVELYGKKIEGKRRRRKNEIVRSEIN